MRKYKINANIKRVIENLYDKVRLMATGAIVSKLHLETDKGHYSHQS